MEKQRTARRAPPMDSRHGRPRTRPSQGLEGSYLRPWEVTADNGVLSVRVGGIAATRACTTSGLRRRPAAACGLLARLLPIRQSRIHERVPLLL